MNRRLRFGPPSVMLPQTSGRRIRPSSLPGRIPHRDAAVAERAAGVARHPEVAVDVAAQAVRSALHAVDQTVGEQLAVRDLVVGADVERVDLAFAARRRCRRGPCPVLATYSRLKSGENVRPFGSGTCSSVIDEVDAAARIDAIDVGRQLALEGADSAG